MLLSAKRERVKLGNRIRQREGEGKTEVDLNWKL